MKKIFYLSFTFILTINSFAQTNHVKHVVLIGLDGFGAYAVPKAEMPRLQWMMKNGSWTLRARNMLPTSSAINWASILMGAGPTLHGYTEWDSKVPEIPSVVTDNKGMFPSVFSILKEQKPEAKTALVFSWGGIDPLVEQGTTDFRFWGEDNEKRVLDTAVAIIKLMKPVLTFIHFDQPDEVGHKIGHDTPEYYEELRNVDLRIGGILDAVREAGIADETVIIVTADHGGIAKGHGGKSLQEIQIPWVVYGAGIKKDNELKNTVVNIDTAATIAWLLGLKIPDSWRGIPIRQIAE